VEKPGTAAHVPGVSRWNSVRRVRVSESRHFDAKGDVMARKYSRGASKKVKRAMHERKRGTLRSGRSGKKVKSRKQAIAIGLSEARRAGKKVPKKRKSKR
jgi:hypothetical protein